MNYKDFKSEKIILIVSSLVFISLFLISPASADDCVDANKTIKDDLIYGEEADVELNLNISCSFDSMEPYDVVLGIDGSGSMSQEIDEVKSAAKDFVNKLESDFKVGVVEYDDDAYRVQGLTNDKTKAKNTIGNLPKGSMGGTAIGDAILKMNDELLNHGRPERNWFGVLLTDGNEQQHTSPKAKARNTPNDITIHTVGYASNADMSLLKYIADETGGDSQHSNKHNIEEVYKDIAEDIMDSIEGATVKDCFKKPVEIVDRAGGSLSETASSKCLEWDVGKVDQSKIWTREPTIVPKLHGIEKIETCESKFSYEINGSSETEPFPCGEKEISYRELDITGVSSSVNSTLARVEVSVKNKGDISTSNTDLAITDNSGNVYKTIDVGSFDPGESKSFEIHFDSSDLPLGISDASAHVDYSGNIPEPDENNNIEDFEFNRGIDLAITDVTSSVNISHVNVNVTVENIGDVDTSQTKLEIRRNIGPKLAEVDVDPLDPGDTVKKEIHFDKFGLLGTVNSVAEVDPSDNIPETNEKNNEEDFTIENKVDLAIKGVSSSINYNNTFINVSIENKGDSATPKTELKINESTGNFEKIVDVDKIPQGSTKKLDVKINTSELPLGLVNATAHVDHLNGIPELNETNNIEQFQIENKFDLAINDVKLAVNSSHANINVTVKNKGDYATPGTELAIKNLTSPPYVEMINSITSNTSEKYELAIDDSRLSVGWNNLTAHVDYYDNIPETNETNNIYEIRVCVGDTIVNCDECDVRAGDNITFNASISVDCGLKKFKICKNSQCTDVYCSSSTKSSCTFDVSKEFDCDFEDKKYWAQVVDKAGNTGMSGENSLTVKMGDKCKCDHDIECLSGSCVGGICYYVEGPGLFIE